MELGAFLLFASARLRPGWGRRTGGKFFGDVGHGLSRGVIISRLNQSSDFSRKYSSGCCWKKCSIIRAILFQRQPIPSFLITCGFGLLLPLALFSFDHTMRMVSLRSKQVFSYTVEIVYIFNYFSTLSFHLDFCSLLLSASFIITRKDRWLTYTYI